MNELGTVARDLVFLRRRVERHRVSPPATIFYLWACIVATGGILTDVAPGVGVVFWIVSGLAGGGASFWLGLRWSRRSGSIKPRTSVRHGLHWGGLLLATLLMGFVEGPRSTEPNTFGAGILLIVGLGYYYAGVHIHGCTSGSLVFRRSATWWLSSCPAPRGRSSGSRSQPGWRGPESRFGARSRVTTGRRAPPQSCDSRRDARRPRPRRRGRGARQASRPPEPSGRAGPPLRRPAADVQAAR